MLEIAPSARGQTGPLVLIGAVFAVVRTFGLVTALRSRGWGWVLRLDADGVTVRDRPTVAWRDVAEVVVTPMQPVWFFWPQLLRLSRGGRLRWPVVTIVPRPGVEMAALPLPGGPVRPDRSSAARQRTYGSQLVLMPHAMSASAEEILTAAQRRGHVAVAQRRRALET